MSETYLLFNRTDKDNHKLYIILYTLNRIFKRYALDEILVCGSLRDLYIFVRMIITSIPANRCSLDRVHKENYSKIKKSEKRE